MPEPEESPPATSLHADTHPPTQTFGQIPDDPNRPTVTLGNPPDDHAATRTMGDRAVMPALVGLPVVPGFDLEREIGRGGMGAVYKARERSLNRTVAIKMLLPERVPMAEELIRFRLEAEVAARVRHPNVVQVFESGQVDMRPYLVMEWVEGGTLSDVIKDTRLFPPLVAAKMMAIIARAVHHAHLNGIVHRDLKPGNVLLARSNTSAGTNASLPTAGGAESIAIRNKGETITVVPKVTDFGLAKLTAGEMGLTETGRVMGTPEFMSPEQAAGRIREIGPASDVHSLGVMLYQLIVGHTPFRGESTYAVVKKVIEEEPKSIRSESQVRNIPFDLETVCMKCLRKNPLERYASAIEFANDLDAILTGRPISARPVGTVERLWKFTKRNPTVTSLAAAFVVSIFGGLAGVTWQWQKTVQERNRAVTAETKAVLAKNTSEAVNQFLINDLIAAAAPDRALGRVVTVQSALDEAASKVESTFAAEPLTAAGVRTALGQSFRKLGKTSLAIPQLRKSYDEFHARLGPDADETLVAGQELAESLDDAGQYAQANQLFDDLFRIASAKFGPEDDRTLTIASKYGLSMQNAQMGPAALDLLERTLKIRERNNGPEDPRTLKILNDLGVIYFFQGNYPTAEEVTRKAVAGRGKRLSSLHPLTIESKNNLATVLSAMKRDEEAITLLEQVVDESTKVRGERHVDTLSALSNLGRAYYQRKAYGVAEMKYQMAADTALSSPDLGPEHPLSLTFRHNLATAQFSNRKATQAIETLSDVIDRRRKILEANHVDTLMAELDLGRIYLANRKPAEAWAVLWTSFPARLSPALIGRDETVLAANTLATIAKSIDLKPDDRKRLTRALKTIWDDRFANEKHKNDAVCRLGMNLCMAEPGDESVSRAQEIYSVRKTLFKDSPGAFGAAAEECAIYLASQNRLTLAFAVAEEAMNEVHRLPETERPARRAKVGNLAGELALKSGNLNRAKSIFGEVLTHHENVSRDAVEQITCHFRLGQCDRQLKLFDSAETHLKTAYDRLQVKGVIDETSRKIRTQAIVQELILLYTEWGKPALGAEWKAKSMN